MRGRWVYGVWRWVRGWSRQLEQALLNQDAALDRSTDKMGMLRKDLRQASSS